MRTVLLTPVVVLWIGATLFAQPVESPLKTDVEIPRAQLAQLYQRELGPLYKSDQADALYAAHKLIEQYFAEPDKRKELIKSIEATGIDPNLLGRITRIRMHWPDLKGGVYYVNEKLGPHNVHYFLGVPKGYDRMKSWPLVIKLPTADAFISEPKPDAEQVKRIYVSWMTAELTKHPDAVIIMPLLNLDELWGPSYTGMNSVIQPMHHAADRVNIDPARVYLLGHSMSAHATWNLALHYPTYFASICAMAGGAGAEWQRLRLMNLRNVLPVVWHDTKDEVIKVDSSRRIVRALRTLKIQVEYDETKELGHVPPERIVHACYERMRGKARELYPKTVALQSNRLDTLFNRNDWIQVYQPTKTGDERRLQFRRGSGFMVIYPNSWKLEATRDKNRIDATTINVDVMRIYLNDQMVDLTKPVTVNVNKRGKFEGIVKPSVEEMLTDQVFLGRGWRYYTAVIDIDLAPAGTPSTRAATQSTRPAPRATTTGAR